MTIARGLLVLALTTTGTFGCASAANQGAASNSGRNQLTRAQLGAANSSNLYEAISKLRPDWLTSRGPTSVDVFMNGSMLGNADYLKELGVLDVSEVRYWDAASASARFGMGHPRGVIEITRK